MFKGLFFFGLTVLSLNSYSATTGSQLSGGAYMQNIASSIEAMLPMLDISFYLMGVIFLSMAMVQISKASVGPAIAKFITGISFLAMPVMIGGVVKDLNKDLAASAQVISVRTVRTEITEPNGSSEAPVGNSSVKEAVQSPVENKNKGNVGQWKSADDY